MKCGLTFVKGYGPRSKTKKEVLLGVFHVDPTEYIQKNEDWTVTSMEVCDGRLVVSVRTYCDHCYPELDITYRCEKCGRIRCPEGMPESEDDVRNLIQSKLDKEV